LVPVRTWRWRRAADIASQLPPELGGYLLEPTSGEGARFGVQDFYDLVSMREGVNIPEAAFHACAVASVLRDAISPGEWRNILARLPPDLDKLLESGSEGAAPSLSERVMSAFPLPWLVFISPLSSASRLPS
jgi:hypothetical protein